MVFDPHLSAFQFAAEDWMPKTDFATYPERWVSEKTKEFIWRGQQDILRSVRDHRYTAVQSCHDAGKSFIAARTIAWWIDTHPPGEAFVVTTAPTAAQVSAILWREVQRAHRKAKLLGRITTAGYPQWKLDDLELIGYGRKPADYADDAFQGIHARYVLVVIDEACGVNRQLFDAVDALVTNEYARVLAIGNPDDPTSHFAEVCRPDSGWNTIRLDGLTTPNFTEVQVNSVKCDQCRRVGRERPLLADLMEQESIPYSVEEVPDDLRPMLLSPLWVEERLHRWVGRPNQTATIAQMASKSSLWVSKVRGLFPTSSTDGVIPLGWVEAAMARWENWVADGRPRIPGNTVIGVDIAGKGEDETAAAIRHGVCVEEIRKYPEADTMEVVGYMAGLNGLHGGRLIVDSIGIGAGVLDRLREMGIPSEGFVASGSAAGIRDASGEFEFTNARSAAWWGMRDLLDPSRGSKVMLPRDEMLLADLTAPTWKLLSKGKIQVEGKADIRKRLGRSTDSGDAVIHSFWTGLGTMDAQDNVGAVSWWGAAADSGSVHRWYSDEDALVVNPDVSLEWSTEKWSHEH